MKVKHGDFSQLKQSGIGKIPRDRQGERATPPTIHGPDEAPRKHVIATDYRKNNS
jgi:hypothetical protein